ncbi:MAG TPA: hypothetical protein VK003_21580 [Oceanobacillus sp.]|nr:hypothetical protein [Oceanobacillus sp.]
MNQNLLSFLREKANTFTKWDLVRFFHDNPHAAEIAPSIARYIGREVGEVERELTNLVKANVLQMQTVSDVQVFRLVDDEETRRMIHEFVVACDDPQFRVKAIHEVIENSH